MSDVPESRAAGDLSVVDAWRLLVKPVPSRPAASYVGIVNDMQKNGYVCLMMSARPEHSTSRWF